MRDKIFYAICFGFIFGILLRSLIYFDFYIILLLILFAVVFVFYFWYISGSKWGLVASFFVLTLTLGSLYFNFREVRATKSAEILSERVGEELELIGIIVDDPIETEKTIRFPVRLAEHKEIKVLVSTSLGEEYKYGDEVKLAGKLEAPENFSTDTGKEFDYVNYLRKDSIYYLVSFADIEVLADGKGNKIKSLLFGLKNKFLDKVNYAIAPPESTLMGGLILGERASFSLEQKEAFVRTGTIHIIALSGYNISIVSDWIMKLFQFLPQSLGLGLGGISILLFVLMTGASSTAVRAGVMALIMLLARSTGRTYDAGRALLLAGVGMLLFNPFVLTFDVSFQLSFTATVAVIFFTPRIEKYFRWVTKSFALREIFSVTTGAYIFVLPFILYKMSNLSIVALPANILVLPFIPMTMGLGFLTGLAGLIFSPLALPIGFATELLLRYELGIINYLSSFSFASYTIPNFPFLLTLLIYIYFIWFLFGKSIKKFFSLIE